MGYKSKYFSGKYIRKNPFSRFKSKVYDSLDQAKRLDFSNAVVLIETASQGEACEIVTSADHGLSTGDRIYIYGVLGMTELNHKEYVVTVVSSTRFTLDGVDSTEYTAYDDEGYVFKLDTEAESEIQEITLFNNGTATIYLAESADKATSSTAGIVLKPNGSYDENVDNLSRFWVNKSETGTVDLRVFTKRYGEGA